MKVEAGGSNSRKLEATVKDKRGCLGTRWRWDCVSEFDTSQFLSGMLRNIMLKEKHILYFKLSNLQYSTGSNIYVIFLCDSNGVIEASQNLHSTPPSPWFLASSLHSGKDFRSLQPKANKNVSKGGEVWSQNNKKKSSLYLFTSFTFESSMQAWRMWERKADKI